MTSLSKSTFIIENTGNKPILTNDIVTPIKIEIPNKVSILDSIIELKNPDNLDASLNVRNNVVTVGFSLLNPSDKIYLGILTDNNDYTFTASARIAGVSQVDTHLSPPTTFSIWYILWIAVCLFSFLLVVISFMGIYQYKDEFKYKTEVKNKTFFIPTLSTVSDVETWVESTFKFALKKEES